MNKKIEVTNCTDCIFNTMANDGTHSCQADEDWRDLPTISLDEVSKDIPEWCPLKSGDIFISLRNSKLKNKHNEHGN